MNIKALMAIVWLAVPAVAVEETPDFTHSGTYVQAAGMKLINAFDTDGTDPSGWGVSGSLGYRFSPWYAMQVDYQWGTMEDSGSFVSPVANVSGTLETKSWSVMGSGKLYPFASSGIRFQPYALIGLGVLDVEKSTRRLVMLCSPTCATSSDTTTNETFVGFAMKFGGGADVHLTERFYLFADYAFYYSIQDAIKGFNFHAIGGGIGYRW